MPTNPSLLIVDDDVGFGRAAADIARATGFDIVIAGTLSQARSRLRACTFELAFVDLTLPDGSGLDLLDACDLEITQVVLVTDQPTVESAIRAFKAPVLDYIIKPLDVQRYREILAAAAARRAQPGRPRAVHALGLVGSSTAMRGITDKIGRAAGSGACVLIHGEAGVGKRRIAAAVHAASAREGRLCTLHCASVAESDVVKLLLGGTEQPGLFEQARGGTLLLDDVTRLSPVQQDLLLLALEHLRSRRASGGDDIHVEPRLVAVMHGAPQQAVRDGLLREALYYRLAEFPIAVPPLRERPEDIHPLADLALAELNERCNTRKVFAAEAVKHMRNHTWPGNVRELRNAVGRAFLMARDNLLTEVVDGAPPRDPLHETAGSITVSVGMTFDEIERRMLFKTLEFFDNDKVRAAEALGISVKTIYNRLARYQAGSNAEHTSSAA